MTEIDMLTVVMLFSLFPSLPPSLPPSHVFFCAYMMWSYAKAIREIVNPTIEMPASTCTIFTIVAGASIGNGGMFPILSPLSPSSSSPPSSFLPFLAKRLSRLDSRGL
jgi:hypothetical protein